MSPVEDLTIRLLDGEISAAQYEELQRLLADDEDARRIHFELCQQEGLLRSNAANFDVAQSTMARLRGLSTAAPEPPPIPPPVISASQAPSPVLVDRGRALRRSVKRSRRSRSLSWIVGAACLLLIVGAMAAYLELPTAFERRQLARALSPEPARITGVGPKVHIQRNGQLLDVSTDFQLQTGDNIRVPDLSWAVFVYQDATRVLLHAGAEVVFQPPAGDELDAASKRLLLRQGTLAAQVAKQSDGRAVELTTANAAARVLGTRLLLATMPDQTKLDVLQGQVRLTRRSDGASVEASAGYSAVARPDAALLARRTAGRVSQDLAVLYLFDEGQGKIVHDRSGSPRPLDLEFADSEAVRWIPGGGLTLHQATVVASQTPAMQIIQACRQVNELTVEAWIKPSRIEQVGPARIISSSTDPYHRNFTLAHETTESGADNGRAFFLTRIRTTAADLNGFPELRTAPGVIETETMHVVYTRLASGEGVIYVDGVPRSRSVVSGDLSGWDDQYRLYLGNEATMDRPWLGEYHLVAIYSRALTGQEILQNLTAPMRGD